MGFSESEGNLGEAADQGREHPPSRGPLPQLWRGFLPEKGEMLRQREPDGQVGPGPRLAPLCAALCCPPPGLGEDRLHPGAWGFPSH